MSQDPTLPAPAVPEGPLQLDVAVPSDATAMNATDRPSVTCAFCRTPLHDEYHQVGKRPACATCRRTVERQIAVPASPGVMLRAVLFALGAAVAGAVVYYGVAEITGLQIGIVAVLIGYMVGWAVQRATGNRGGRRFQIVAAVFTYWSVGLAYTPLAFKSFGTRDKVQRAAVAAATAAADSARATVSPPAGSSAPSSARAFGTGVAVLFGFAFVLPMIAVLGSLPGGLLTGIIIFVGLRQAWRMTAPRAVSTSGPYRVGGSVTP